MSIIPTLEMKEVNFGVARALVRKSAICSDEEIGSKRSIPF